MKNELPASTSQLLYLNSMDSRAGVTYIFRNLMIEEGTKASAWTPAIEDVNNSIDAVKQVTESNSTTINVMQGQISTAINNTQIVKDGKTTLLKDDYNKTVAKVDSINSTIGTHTTKIDQLTGNITSVDTKVNSVQRDLEGTKSTVSSHTTQINGLNSTVSSQSSSINQLKDKITLKVEASDITNAVNNISIGGRNLLVKNALESGNISGVNGSVLTGTYANFYRTKNFIDIENGSKYILKVNKGASGDIIEKIVAYNSSGTYISTQYVNAKQTVFTPPANCTKIKFIVTIANANASTIIESFKIKLEIGTKPTDWTAAPEDVDSAITSVDNKVTSTNNKVATIETNLSSITSRVSTTENNVKTINGNVSSLQSRMSSAEQKITSSAIISTVQSTINSAKNEAINSANSSTDSKLKNYATSSSLTQTTNSIVAKFTSNGGYNLLKNSKGKNGTSFWLNNGGGIRVEADATFEKCFYTQAPSGIKYSEAIRLKNNTEYVYEGYVYSRNAISGNSASPLHFWCNTTASGSGSPQLSVLDYRQAVTTVNKWTKCYVHFRTAASGNVFFTPFIYVGGSTNFELWVTELSLSESSTESKWTPHPDEVYNGSTVIDANGVTINNGALTVKNKAGSTVLSGDSNGNLTMTGNLKSQNGEQWVGLDSGGITFKDSHKNEQLLRAATTYHVDNRDQNGVNFALAKYGDYIRFSHISKDDLTGGWSSATDSQYRFMDMWSADVTIGSAKFKKGINVFSPMYLNNGLRLNYKNAVNYQNYITSSAWNSVEGLLGLYGDNGACIGYQDGSNLMSRIVVTEAAMPGTGDHIKSWGNWNCSGYTVHNATFTGRWVNSYANFTARTLTETTCIEAEHKQVRVNFEDIQLQDGKAILNIPKRYMHINTGYTVASIVKKGKGDVWVAEELENRFIIEGTEDIKVNIEIIIYLENESLYATRKADNSQLCIDMSTGQPEE